MNMKKYIVAMVLVSNCANFNASAPKVAKTLITCTGFATAATVIAHETICAMAAEGDFDKYKDLRNKNYQTLGNRVYDVGNKAVNTVKDLQDKLTSNKKN